MTHNAETLSPAEYFNYVKSQVQTTDAGKINSLFKTYSHLAQQAFQTGQMKLYLKLCFNAFTAMREMKAIEHGYTQWVSAEALAEFISKTKSMSTKTSFGGTANSVRVIELQNFTRAIPEDCQAELQKVQSITYALKDPRTGEEKEYGLFDDIIIVYTDLTGCKVTEEYVQKNKDPIAFGVFLDEDNRENYGRFYRICDWEDDYCNLTFSKMVEQMDRQRIQGHGSGTPDDFIAHINTHYTVAKEKLKVSKKSFRPYEMTLKQRLLGIWRLIRG